MIINNKQINIWRGLSPPPTIYHMWLYNDKELRLHNGIEWVLFISDAQTIEIVTGLVDKVEILELELITLQNNTINNKKISTNPVLNGNDILNTSEGLYIQSGISLSDTTLKLDTLLSTQIIE